MHNETLVKNETMTPFKIFNSMQSTNTLCHTYALEAEAKQQENRKLNDTFNQELVNAYGADIANSAIKSAGLPDDWMSFTNLGESEVKAVITNANDRAIDNFIRGQGKDSLVGVIETQMSELELKKAERLNNDKQPDLTKKEKQFLETWSMEYASSPVLHKILKDKVQHCLSKSNLDLIPTPEILKEFTLQAIDTYMVHLSFESMLGRIGTQQFGSGWLSNQSSVDVDIFNQFFNLQLDGYTILSLRGVEVPALSQDEQQFLSIAFTGSIPEDWGFFESSHPLINYVLTKTKQKSSFEHLSDCITTLRKEKGTYWPGILHMGISQRFVSSESGIK